MKATLCALAAATLLWTVPAEAADDDLLAPGEVPGEFSANVAITTDYLFRGISQTDREVALQGGFDYAVDTPVDGVGFYAGAWGSNIDFDSGADGTLELDYYAGFNGEVEGVSWDVGYLFYHYPNSRSSVEFDYWEVYGSLGYDFGVASASAGVSYSPDFFGGTGDAVYYQLDAGVPLYKSLSAIAHVGWQSIDGVSFKPGAADSYGDYKLGAGATVLGFGVELVWWDTWSIADASINDGSVVFTVSKAF